MSKLRADSRWNEVTDEQIRELESWLFEENIPYREALERLEKRFGIVVPLSTLARFYQHLARERTHEELLSLNKAAWDVDHSDADQELLTVAAMKLVSKRLVQLAIEKPDKVREMATLARILVARENLQIRKAWVDMAEERRMDEVNDRLAAAKRQRDAHLQTKAILDEINAQNRQPVPPVPSSGSASQPAPPPAPP